jgi:hypothetical protein
MPGTWQASTLKVAVPTKSCPMCPTIPPHVSLKRTGNPGPHLAVAIEIHGIAWNMSGGDNSTQRYTTANIIVIVIIIPARGTVVGADAVAFHHYCSATCTHQVQPAKTLPKKRELLKTHPEQIIVSHGCMPMLQTESW